MADNLVGLDFDRLTVIARAGSRGSRRLWQCVCICGKVTTATTRSLTTAQKRSCGCLSSEIHSASAKNKMTTHGKSHTSLFKRWQTMISRCHNKNVSCYNNYGGRGITVCDRWRQSFESFSSDVGVPTAGMTLERINNDLGYSPTNVRWASRREQALNKRTNRLILFNGTPTPLQIISEKTGLHRRTISSRLDKLGWTEVEAVGGSHR